MNTLDTSEIEDTLDTVILEVADPAASRARFIHAWETGTPATAARIGFATPELMWQILNARRWAILKAMTGAGPLALRDVKAVHTDTRILLRSGVIDRTEDGKLVFPYRHVKMQFELDAAA